MECIIVFISLIALFAIIGILFTFNNRLLCSWHSIFRPNTIISALSTLSKSAMLMAIGQGLGQLKWVYFEQRPHRLLEFETFDSASRGPLGSVRFIYAIHWRAAAASFGALLTVLALAMDPFVQQVISYEPALAVDDRLESTISIARAYDTNNVNNPGPLSPSREFGQCLLA